jgi:hypothetical protein
VRELDLPQEFVVQREIHAIQHFGQSLYETIPPGEVILADRPSNYARMIEIVWQEKRYLIFARDLAERAEPLGKSVEEDPPERVSV